MADQQTPPGTEGAAPAAGAGVPPKAEAPKFTAEQRYAHHELAFGLRQEAKIEEVYNKAVEAAAGDVTKIGQARTARNEALGAVGDGIDKRLTAAGEKASTAFDNASDKFGEAMKAVAGKLPTSAKVAAHFSDHAGKYAAGGLLVALVAKMFGKKEEEQADGTKKEKMGFLAKAAVAVGAVVGVAAAVEKLAPATKLGSLGKWAGKIAGERHVQEAMNHLAGNPGQSR